MAAEHPANSPWDVKHLRGGLIDVEFTVQGLQLLHANARPEILDPNTAAALGKLAAAGFLSPSDAETLRRALELWQALQAVLRLTLDPVAAANPAAQQTMRPDRGAGGEDGAAFPESLKRRLVRIGGAADFAGLEARMGDLARAAADVFRRAIEVPAGPLT
jgi:glutamate-ammonia-ligase adenylyltransferase